MSGPVWQHVGAGLIGGAISLAPIPGAVFLGGAVGGVLTGLANGRSGRELLADAAIGAAGGWFGGHVRAVAGATGMMSNLNIASAAPLAAKIAQALGAGASSMLATALYDHFADAPREIAIPGKSTRLRALETVLAALGEADSVKHLRQGIDIALQIPPLPGVAPGIEAEADVYSSASALCKRAQDNFERTATFELPNAWHGQAGQTLSESVLALSSGTSHAADALASASGALQHWADTVTTTQAEDTAATTAMRDVREKLNTLSHNAARIAAITGCQARIDATRDFEAAATTTVSTIGAAAQAARASKVGAGIDPLTAETLAYTGSDQQSSDPSEDILTPIGLARASQRAAVLTPSDRSAFGKLLANAKSPQEAAYLWEALAAGYSLPDITAFDQQIHPHGDDLQWLERHLHVQDLVNYQAEGTGITVPIGYSLDDPAVKAVYEQNDENCTTASVLVARLDADPVLMLGITTGTGPAAVDGPVVGDDSPGAFRDRLVHAFNDNFDPDRTPWPKGNQNMVNDLITPITGTRYEMHTLSSQEAREAVLPRIQAAVAAGQPIPLGLDLPSGREGHQVIIIGQRPGQLEIYNPFGYTEWVTTEQFVNSRMPFRPIPARIILPD
ncbi:hypothetical protein ABZ319_16235 [Nocardia sp. NPDC005978]|uniref:hypothetical protein n=1 Tax=Nocardia sp. NPDC005978 TaxID=3156725 RepID=UPI0033B212C2